MKRTALIFILLLILAAFPIHSTAQGVDPCGVVDAIDYPVDGVSIENDDFGMYRAVFNGRHSGIDVAFGRLGDPVRAAARGRVTYSDPEGWDTEKGVVIIEHVFPDDHIYFTLYGHVVETDTIKLLKSGSCVEKGQIIAAVGNPSRGAPHLHYEIRTMEASTGGPGYWPVDPLIAGWLHPIDFTERWRLRLTPAYSAMLSADSRQTVRLQCPHCGRMTVRSCLRRSITLSIAVPTARHSGA
jgi:murein DD-endopeptidase MepM/ murein hydrolase activator NlpD